MYYDFVEGDWNFENGYEMAYDTTVSIDQIAGFNRFWDALEIGGPILGRVDVVIPVYNKLFQMKVLEWETEFNLIDFHYSDYNNLPETTENQLVVWPNPASETVHIDGVEAAEVQVYNSLGQLVKIIQGNNEIGVRDLAEGVYVLRVASEDGTRYMERVAVRR